ncbi:hypothetical protein [Methylovulum miyakonense]|uniref:hypothetical protein n=1 Tax=Methylovulum miyakonense TaxID=645578 RepID=UPI000372FA78|nr:hypothetical protein [Methylovulum miyakonense]
MNTQSSHAQNPEQNTTEPFILTVLTHDFSPRAKYGEQLIMLRGEAAEEGDIVAISEDCRQLAFYTDGLDYYAAAIGVTNLGSRRFIGTPTLQA